LCYEVTITVDLKKFIRALQKAGEVLDRFGKPYSTVIGISKDPESGYITWFIQFRVKHKNYRELLELWDDVSSAFHSELEDNFNVEIEPEEW